MVSFINAVTKVQWGPNLTTKTPTKEGLRTVLEAAVKPISNGHIPALIQSKAMFSMGAYFKGIKSHKKLR